MIALFMKWHCTQWHTGIKELLEIWRMGKKYYLEHMKLQTTLFQTICAWSLLWTPQFLIWNTEFDRFPCLQHRADWSRGSELSCGGYETVQVCLKKSLQHKIYTFVLKYKTFCLEIAIFHIMQHSIGKSFLFS